MIRAFAVALVACTGSRAPAPGSPDELAAYLRGVTAADEPTRRREVTGWILDEPTWHAIVVEPFGGLWADYARGFDAQVTALVTRLGPGPITARRHYAGDRRLTDGEARLRWALPVQYPSAVAELGGAPIDAVFVHDGGHWRVLAGLDELVLAKVRAQDPACAERVVRAGPSGRCTEVGWLVVDAALRMQSERFAHACQLAATLCGSPSP